MANNLGFHYSLPDEWVLMSSALTHEKQPFCRPHLSQQYFTVVASGIEGDQRRSMFC